MSILIFWIMPHWLAASQPWRPISAWTIRTSNFLLILISGHWPNEQNVLCTIKTVHKTTKSSLCSFSCTDMLEQMQCSPDLLQCLNHRTACQTSERKRHFHSYSLQLGYVHVSPPSYPTSTVWRKVKYEL